MLPSVLKRIKRNMILEKILEKYKRIKRRLIRKASKPKMLALLKFNASNHQMRTNIM